MENRVAELIDSFTKSLTLIADFYMTFTYIDPTKHVMCNFQKGLFDLKTM